MPWRTRNSLVKAFEPSSCAGALRGPKQGRPRVSNRSTMPATSGTSGPTMVSATSSPAARSASASSWLTSMAMLRTLGSRAVPALPGATSTSLTRGDCAHFHASACSRPPPPITSTLYGLSMSTCSVAKVAHAGEQHRNVRLVGGGDDFGIAQRAARLDDGAHAMARGDFDAVAKRKEGIRGQHRAAHREARVLGLDRADAAGIDAAHLAGAHADGGLATREHDGIGFHELAHAPRKGQIAQLLLAGRATRDAFQLRRFDAARIAILHQHAAAHAAQFALRRHRACQRA